MRNIGSSPHPHRQGTLWKSEKTRKKAGKTQTRRHVTEVMTLSGTMRANLGVDTAFGQSKSLHWAATNQVLRHNLASVLCHYVAVPDSFWINDDGRTVLALIQTSRLVDAHSRTKAGSFCVLLKLRV